MEPSASPDLLALATLAGCPPAQDRHRLDCLVRWLRAHGWAGALTLGITEPLTITAGIGTLRLGPEGECWEPAAKPTPPAPPQPSPEPLRLARIAACAACDRFRDDRCTVSGCGCTGLGKPERMFSKCPLGRWVVPTS